MRLSVDRVSLYVFGFLLERTYKKRDLRDRLVPFRNIYRGQRGNRQVGYDANEDEDSLIDDSGTLPELAPILSTEPVSI